MTSQGVVQSVVSQLTRLYAGQEQPVLLHAPFIPAGGWEFVKDCLDTGWISSAGSYVNRIEDDLAALTGARRAVATVNGTAALQMALLLSGVRADDEVLIPSLTFVATANAVSHCGATPHFVDVDAQRLSVDPEKLDTYLQQTLQQTSAGAVNRHTNHPVRALCVMHCLGHPADLDGLLDVCRRHHLVLVEDAAESLGSWYGDVHTGNHGLVSALSFNGNKIVSTGGGGAILTNDDQLADRAKHLTTTGKVPHAWEFIHDEIAWNYRMPNINAALGCAQLEALPQLLSAKRRLAETLADLFEATPGVEFLFEPSECRSNYWLNAIVLDRDVADQRDDLLQSLNDKGLQSRPLWRPMHTLPMYQNHPSADLTVTDDVCRRVINIPSSAHLAPGWGGLEQESAGQDET